MTDQSLCDQRSLHALLRTVQCDSISGRMTSTLKQRIATGVAYISCVFAPWFYHLLSAWLDLARP